MAGAGTGACRGAGPGGGATIEIRGAATGGVSVARAGFVALEISGVGTEAGTGARGAAGEAGGVAGDMRASA